MLADPDVREMARARNIAHEELGRIVGYHIYDEYIEFENRHGNTWRVAREPQTRVATGHEDRLTSTQPWIERPLEWFQDQYETQPEQEIISNDRHSPNRQRRPEGVPQGHNVSRFGHSRRHRE